MGENQVRALVPEDLCSGIGKKMLRHQYDLIAIISRDVSQRAEVVGHYKQPNTDQCILLLPAACKMSVGLRVVR